MRHGEVFNPDRVLYGRLPGFRLSELGELMAQSAADDLAARGRPVTHLVASPLLRTQQSARPHAALFDLDIATDARLIEPTNHFEGTVMAKAVKNPINWPWLINPLRPSWGEAYSSIARRMGSAIDDAFALAPLGPDEPGDVVLVSHQLPIWVLHLAVAGERFAHDPRQRRCSLSSITTFEQRDGGIVEVGYSDPGTEIEASAIDVGAV